MKLDFQISMVPAGELVFQPGTLACGSMRYVVALGVVSSKLPFAISSLTSGGLPL